MGEFRIGRKHASHSYPSTPRAPAPALLQIGSDLVTEDFAIVGATPSPVKVERVAGTLLQVPLEDFRRDNGLWVQVTATLSRADTGDVALLYIPWVKFASLPQYFAPGVPGVGAGLTFDQVNVNEQAFQAIALTLDFLVKLPAASSDVAPIALPAVDDILVGIAAQGSVDFEVGATSIITAGEMHRSIITQAPTISLVTLP